MTEDMQHKFYNKYDTSYYGVLYLKFKTTVDMAKILIEKIGKEETLKELEKYGESVAKRSVQNIVKKSPINNFEDFRNAFKGLLNSPLFETCLTYDIVEDTDKKFKMKVTECLWTKVFNDLQEPEIGYCSNCHSDFAMAEAFHPKIKLTRTKTLMQGDDQCDHTYTWEE
ncbi:MAG: L-2-amino-thiazoline-4-carboxylic acid hydrolase [Candidatus Heimdallarchaeota archaeon]